MNGRRLVLGLLLLGVACAAGAAWYRKAARAPLAAALADERARAGAFLKLLRMNNVWGLADAYALDERSSSPGSVILETAGGDSGPVWLVARGVKQEPGGRLTLAAFVFAANGTLAKVIEGAVPVLLAGSPRAAVAGVWAARRDLPGRRTSIYLVREGLPEVLRADGPFHLVTAAGKEVRAWQDITAEAQLGAGGEEAALRYDANRGVFIGPASGGSGTLRVDVDASPSYRASDGA